MRTSFLLVFTVCCTTMSVAGPSAFADDESQFVDVVQPLLEAKCVSCHGTEKQEGGLRLDSLAAAKNGGEQGPAIVPGDVAKSLLVRAITFRDPDLQMPPKQKLTDKEIALLTQWVKAGAVWPVATVPEATSQATGDAFTDKRNPIRKLFRGERLDLWSMKLPRSVTLRVKPSAADKVVNNSVVMESQTTAIDAFIRERLTQEKLAASPEADRRSLIRRLTFDLTGLPPTPQEVVTFLADKSPNAYDKLVDRLLDSPRYGERQARLWLDVVRYADTNGYERDEFRPLAWQYRDYVIRSFNQDKPFDQFIREQLAGDELISVSRMGTPARPVEGDTEQRTGKSAHPTTAAEADMLIATGYLRLGQWDSTATIFQEENRLRAEMMADLTNTTASAFLGLTMSCCQCHDHKYDPLSQADHFRLRAFFAGVTSRDDLAISLADEQAEIDEHNAELDRQLEPLKTEQAQLDQGNKTRHEELKAMIAEVESKKRQPRRAMGAIDSGLTAPATHVFYQGDFSSPREEVLPGFPSIFTPGPAVIQPPRDNTTGRRLALANWIASAENSWTARVIVNRLWQQHFGTGLVATPNDFGFSGERPTHPELLDWLAVEFTRRGWSIKEVHRLIVTSATYRQVSAMGRGGKGAKGKQGDVDPENKLLGRQNVRRLDAETLRDSLLAVSGLLKPYESGKPLWPPVPDELRHAQPAILEAEKGGDGGRMQGWYADPIEQTDVRSVFLVRKRCLPIPFLQAFDLPDTTVSCARRETTVVAPQALMLLNSPEGIRYAHAFAERVQSPIQNLSFDDAAQINLLAEAIFQQAFQRRPTADEVALASEFLRRHRDQHAATELADRAMKLALTDLCRAVLNLNEFAYID